MTLMNVLNFSIKIVYIGTFAWSLEWRPLPAPIFLEEDPKWRMNPSKQQKIQVFENNEFLVVNCTKFTFDNLCNL